MRVGSCLGHIAGLSGRKRAQQCKLCMGTHKLAKPVQSASLWAGCQSKSTVSAIDRQCTSVMGPERCWQLDVDGSAEDSDIV